MSRREIVTTCTRNCPNICGLIAVVEDGRLVGLSGDPNHSLTGGVTTLRGGDIDAYARYRDQFDDAFFAGMRDRFPLLVARSAEFCRNVARNRLRL